MEEAYDFIEPQIFCSKQHLGYVNSLSIDTVEHQLMLCGGSDSAVTIWDLDAKPDEPQPGDPWVYQEQHSQPLARLERKQAHEFGISKVSWWPFDQAMFLTSSFDGRLKIWDSEELEAAYTFDLKHKIYSFDVNPLQEDDGLVAVGMDHPMIRLIDLRSGSAAQTLKGQSSGSVNSVKWSPTREYMLASGGSDGSVRIWDIRQAKQQVASMDVLRVSTAQLLTPLQYRRAHRSACNGLAWHPTGDEILSVGLDSKALVWDLTGEPGGGTNKSVNFGPLFHDRRPQTLDPCISPMGDLEEDGLYVFLPSDTGDLLMCDYSDGKLVKRLVPPGSEVRNHRQACIVARGPKKVEYFSGACDGSVIRWREHAIE